ncbi:MAG: alpha/beta hydrolase family protein [Alphaproteobacteria bacterium]
MPLLRPAGEAEERTYAVAPRVVESFRSDGRLVRVEAIRPVDGPMHRPAVLMLHGAGGLGGGWLVYPHGEELARRGIDVFVVRYYDGIKGGDPTKASPSLHDRREQIISEAIAFVAAKPEVDADRIGIYGMSLGGFHALALGTHDSRVAAVANVMGAMPRQIALGGVTRMPPTLFIHGARDRIVPIGRMYEVARHLDTIGAEYEVKVYLDQGHNLAGAAHPDSVATVADFFDRQLNGGVSVARAPEAGGAVNALTSLAEVTPVVAAPTRPPATASRAAAPRSAEVRAASRSAQKPAARPAPSRTQQASATPAATKTTPAKPTAAKPAATRTAAARTPAAAKPPVPRPSPRSTASTKPTVDPNQIAERP